ncbi:MAG: TorF family putative porin [Gammaproteobacteria bacterium]
MNKLISTTAALTLAGATSLSAHAGSFTGNISASNNYLWRGLTQTTNEPAVSGGIDYAHDSGFYIGTWASNVQYASDDVFSYEHDIYVGYAGEYNGVSYDFGYLYYNYDEEGDIDFGELYGSLGYMGFSVTAWLFAHTENDESNGLANIGRNYDYGFGSTYYISGDYEVDIYNGLMLGLHVGYHDGDFVDGFNFADGTFDYFDYNASLSKGGFGFVVSHTDLGGGRGDNGLQNGSVKFVVSYTVDFDF